MGFLMDRAYIAKHRKHYDIVTSFWDLGDGNTTAAAAAEGAISWDQIYRRRVFRQMSLERLWTPVHLAAKNEDVGVLQAMLFFGARTDLLKIIQCCTLPPRRATQQWSRSCCNGCPTSSTSLG